MICCQKDEAECRPVTDQTLRGTLWVLFLGVVVLAVLGMGEVAVLAGFVWVWVALVRAHDYYPYKCTQCGTLYRVIRFVSDEGWGDSCYRLEEWNGSNFRERNRA